MNAESKMQSEMIAEAKPFKMVIRGSFAEAIGGLVAAAVSIIGLAGAGSVDLASIAAIVIGAGLLFEAVAFGARYSRLWAATGGGDWLRAAELGGGLSAELLGGAGGLILGLLALLGVHPETLTPVAAIVFGGALLLGSAALARVNYLTIAAHEAHESVKDLAREAVSAASGLQVIIGMAATTLGILALLGFDPITLTLVGLLCASLSALISGTALSRRVALLLRG
jgi:hypothetical protein